MAHATKISQAIRKVERVPRIQLILTEGEADLLQETMARIGGHRHQSPRKYADRIAKALREATGQDHRQTDAYRLARNGFIVFCEYGSDPELRERSRARAQRESR